MTKAFQNAVMAICFTLCLSQVSFALETPSSLSHMLSQQLGVSGNMNHEKFHNLIQQGFKSVIVNRPDQELGNQVTVGQLRTIAEKAKVSVIYQPIMSGQPSNTEIEEFARYYNELPKPILMVCKSGSRSSKLYHQAKLQGLLHE